MGSGPDIKERIVTEMKKEFEWELSLNGEMHRACCVCSDNRYVVYLDDDHVTNPMRRPRPSEKRPVR